MIKTKLNPGEPVMVVCGDEGCEGVPGEYKKCHVCQAQIFVSDSTYSSVKINKLEAQTLLFFCIACGRQNMGSVEEFAEPTEEQKREVKEFWSKKWKGVRE